MHLPIWRLPIKPQRPYFSAGYFIFWNQAESSRTYASTSSPKLRRSFKPLLLKFLRIPSQHVFSVAQSPSSLLVTNSLERVSCAGGDMGIMSHRYSDAPRCGRICQEPYTFSRGFHTRQPHSDFLWLHIPLWRRR